MRTKRWIICLAVAIGAIYFGCQKKKGGSDDSGSGTVANSNTGDDWKRQY
jgi:hypothetical protein